MLLIATSLRQLKQMTKDLAEAATDCGLEIHPEKTKMLTGQKCRKGANAEEYVSIGQMKVQILKRE